MTVEERLSQLLGTKDIQLASLATQIEQLQTKVKELENELESSKKSSTST